MIEVERVGEQQDCKHCSRTYGTLGCCSTVSNKWVYSCEEGHREYEETHKHKTIPEAKGRLESFIDTFNICKEHDNALVAVSISKEDIQAFTQAIKALNLQPCEDAVNRQAVLDTLDKMDKALDTDRTVENYKDLLTECYKDLPPVTPKGKAAEWYEADGCKGACEGYMSAGVICSQCGEVLCGYIGDYDYCPNCGTRKVSE